MKALLRYITVAFFCFSSILLQAQGNARTITVVEDENKFPVSGLELTVDFRPTGPLLSGKTDSTGVYRFTQGGAFKLNVLTPEDFSYFPFEAIYTGIDQHIVVIVKRNEVKTNPITVTGTFGPRPVSRNPFNVQVITKEKIAALAAQNLGEVLLNETNIQLGQDQVLGASAIMQGIGGQDIKILMNGIPLIGRVNGNIDVSQIPVSNIERIEIIQGPMSVVYGTDALGGVINIITKTPVTRKIAGSAKYFMDNLSNYNLDVSLTMQVAKKTPLMLNFGRYFFDGVDFNKSTRSMDWKPKLKYFGDAAVFLHTEKATHRISSSVYWERLTDRSDAESNLITVVGYNAHYFTTRWDNAIHSVFKIDRHKRFEWQNAYNYYVRAKNTIKRDLVTGMETPYRPEDQDTTSFRYFNSRGIYSKYDPEAKFNFIGGYDFSQQHGYGKRIPATNPGISDVALFGSLEYAPNKTWEVRPSLRVLYNSRFGDPMFKSLFGDHLKIAPVIPSLQLKYNLSEHLSFRGSFSKGFRAPDLKELYFYFVDVNHNVHGNENLQAETSDNYILSFDYRHKLPKGMGTVFAFSLYNNIIRNKINLALSDASTNLYTYINIGRFRSQGLNINFEFFTRQFSWSFNSSFLNVMDLLQQADTFNQKYYVNGQVSTNFTYKIPRRNMSVSLFSRYTSPTNGYTEDKQRYKVSGFFLMDLTAQKQLQRLPITIGAGCKNLLNVTTVNSSRSISSGNPHAQDGVNIFITPGRLFFFQVTYNLTSVK